MDRGAHDGHDVRVTTLKERLEWVLKNKVDLVGNRSRWSTLAGVSRKQVDQLLMREKSNEGRVELRTIVALARVAEVSAAWLAFDVGGPDEPSAGTFLLKLHGPDHIRIPGLLDVITSNPERWRATTLVRATTTVFASDEAGVPISGWAKALDGLERGTTSGDATAATELVLKKIKGRRPKMPPGA